MAKIHVFGNASSIPQEVVDWIYLSAYYGNEFLIGDRKGFDKELYMCLSRIGALNNTTLYCMGNIRNDVKHDKVKMYNTVYDEQNKIAYVKHEDEVVAEFEDTEKEGDWFKDRRWCEFLDKKMAEDCDVALCVRQDNGDDNIMNHMIQMLSIRNKNISLIKV